MTDAAYKRFLKTLNAQADRWGPMVIWNPHHDPDLDYVCGYGLLDCIARRLDVRGENWHGCAVSGGDVEAVEDVLRDAAENDDICLASKVLGELGLFVGRGDVAQCRAWPLGIEAEDRPEVWATVVENTPILGVWLLRADPSRKVRARKVHDCANWWGHGNLPPRGNSAIHPGDTYHACTVEGEGTVRLCAECVERYGWEKPRRTSNRPALDFDNLV